MSSTSTFGRRLLVLAGLLVPVFYFGVQVLALPWAPEYDFLTQTASELGMNSVSQLPSIFNVGTVLRGGLMAAAAVGFFLKLKELSAPALAVWLVALAMACIALNDVGAGLFPLPDERHEGVFLVGYLIWPPAFLAATWRLANSAPLRAYMLLSIAMTAALIVWRVVAGEHFAVAGLFQRLLGLATVVPFGVASWFLTSRLP